MHLDSGDWQRRYRHLLARTELDVGLPLIYGDQVNEPAQTETDVSGAEMPSRLKSRSALLSRSVAGSISGGARNDYPARR